MGMSSQAAAPAPVSPGQLIAQAWQLSWWVLIFPAALIVALALHSVFFLNFVHVICGVLWTGTDLFMGFIIGPILRSLAPDQRGAMVRRLMPRMLFYMPALSITVTTAGWYLAHWTNIFASAQLHGWYIAALTVGAWMAVQGVAVLLPTNLMVYFEAQKERPDVERIKRLMTRYKNWVAFQGLLQVATIFVMANFVF